MCFSDLLKISIVVSVGLDVLVEVFLIISSLFFFTTQAIIFILIVVKLS